MKQTEPCSEELVPGVTAQSVPAMHSTQRLSVVQNFLVPWQSLGPTHSTQRLWLVKQGHEGDSAWISAL